MEVSVFNGIDVIFFNWLLLVEGPQASPPKKLSELIPGGAPVSRGVDHKGELADCLVLGGGVF